MKELKARLEHIGHLIQEAQEEELRSYLCECLETLDKGPLLPERFHKPVLKALKHSGLWQHMEMICWDLEQSYGDLIHEDESIKRMLRAGRKAIRMACHIPFAPPKLHGELWWKGWAEAPEENEGGAIANRFLGYIMSEGAGGFLFQFADRAEDGYLKITPLPVDHATLLPLIAGGKPKPKCRFEMVGYDNDTMLFFFEE